MNIITPQIKEDEQNIKAPKLATQKGFTQKDASEILIQEKSDILNNNEIDIITQTLRNSEMHKPVIQIINELGKNICDGEIPSLTMLENVVCDVIYGNTKINAEMASVCFSYIVQIQKILNKLQDRKNIAPLFNERLPKMGSNPDILQFRKTKLQSIKSQTPNQPQLNHSNNYTYPNTTKTEPSTIVSKETSTRNNINHTKIKAEYEAINGKDYSEKFPEFKRTDNIETDVPLLTTEDIAFSIYNGGYECITRNTKVPSFDIRQSAQKFFEKNGTRDGVFSRLDGQSVLGRPYSFYNDKDDISHIMVFGDNRGLNAVIHISIKGKVSQKDAVDLIKHLKHTYSFQIDPFTGNPYNMHELSRPKIQETVMDFFNNK